MNNVIKIIKYPDDIILHSITKRHGEMYDEVIKGLTNLISTAHYRSDFFCTIMYNNNSEIIGYANFIRSSSEPSKWFYADLWVTPEYRRQGCATLIINTARQHLSEFNAKTLLCTVEPHNEASLNMHKALKFEQIETVALSTQRKNIYIHTTSDNLIMQSLCKKAGYVIVEETNHLNEDKTESVRYTLRKEILLI